MFVSPVQQSESAICMHISPPSWTCLLPPPPSHPSSSSQTTKLSSLGSFLLAIYFTHGSVYMLTLLSQFIPPSPSPFVFTCLFSTSISLFLPCKKVNLYHFFLPYIYIYIYTHTLIGYLFLSFWKKALNFKTVQRLQGQPKCCLRPKDFLFLNKQPLPLLNPHGSFCIFLMALSMLNLSILLWVSIRSHTLF